MSETATKKSSTAYIWVTLGVIVVALVGGMLLADRIVKAEAATEATMKAREEGKTEAPKTPTTKTPPIQKKP